MSIITKTGDRGRTGLFTGQRVSKSDARIQVLGALDELNSWLGLIRAKCRLDLKDPDPQDALEQIQRDLFELGSFLGGLPDEDESMKNALARLESWAFGLEKELEPLKNFILPSGHPLAAELHVARSVCRRAERQLAAVKNQTALPPVALPYLNRLSDFLFLLARSVNKKMNTPETIWKKL